MQLEFTKMHGLGNDFVVIDGYSTPVHLTAEQIRAIADRRFGVGCDQLLLVERPDSAEAEFRYRIFNADGGEVEHCGNGARCFARFVRDRGLTDSDEIPVQTSNNLIHLRVVDEERVCVDMGIPVLEPDRIPFVAEAEAVEYDLEVDGALYSIGAVSMGNPHAVLTVDSVETAPVARLGPKIEHHRRFPNRVNVGFMEVVADDRIELRVWERGVGETMACGTGACAAVVAGRLQQILGGRVSVGLRGGELLIEWPGPGRPLTMTGPAARVFEGRMQL